MSTHKRRRSSSFEDGRALVASPPVQSDLPLKSAIKTESPSNTVASVKSTAVPSTSAKSIPVKIPYVPPVFPITYPQRIVLPEYLPADYKPSGNGKALTWYWNKVPPEVSAHLIAYNLITGEDVRVEDLHLPKPVADLTRQEAQTALATYMNETSRHIEYPITYPRIRASPNKWGKAWPEMQAKRRKLGRSNPAVVDDLPSSNINPADKSTPSVAKPASKEPHPQNPNYKVTYPASVWLRFDNAPEERTGPRTTKSRQWSWHQSKDSVHPIAINDLTGEDVRIEDLTIPQPLASLTQWRMARRLVRYMEETSGRNEVVQLTYPRVRASDSAWGRAWRGRMASKDADRVMSLPIRQFR